jgi:hypothetical protein
MGHASLFFTRSTVERRAKSTVCRSSAHAAFTADRSRSTAAALKESVTSADTQRAALSMRREFLLSSSRLSRQRYASLILRRGFQLAAFSLVQSLG